MADNIAIQNLVKNSKFRASESFYNIIKLYELNTPLAYNAKHA